MIDRIRGLSPLLAALAVATSLAAPAVAQAAPKVRLNLRVSGPGRVVAGADHGALRSCRGRCRLKLRRGARVALVARAAKGAGFVGFGGACPKRRPTCSLRMRRSKSVVARFKRAKAIALRVTGSGSVSSGAAKPCAATCSLPGPAGHVRVLLAAPGDGQDVTWSGCKAAAGPYCVARDGAKVAAAFAPAQEARVRAAGVVPVSLTVDIAGPRGLNGVTGDIFASGVDCRDECHYALNAPSSSQFILLGSPYTGATPSVLAFAPTVFDEWNSCSALGGTEDSETESDGEISVCFGPVSKKLNGPTGSATVDAGFDRRHVLRVSVAGKGRVREDDARKRDEVGQPIGYAPINCTDDPSKGVCARGFNREGAWSLSNLEAKPDRGWNFEKWIGCPVSRGAGPRGCLVPSGYGNANVTAVFTRRARCQDGPPTVPPTSCITGLTYSGADSSIKQIVDQNSGACANGNWISTDIAWQHEIDGTHRLYDGQGMRGDEDLFTGTYTFDIDCGLLQRHCKSKFTNTNPVLATVHGTEGNWEVTIQAYDGDGETPDNSCPYHSENDPTIRASFEGTVHLRGKPGHPKPRTVGLTVTRNSSYTPTEGEKTSSSVHGHITVSGIW